MSRSHLGCIEGIKGSVLEGMLRACLQVVDGIVEGALVRAC